ncbi:hypothetical protein T01_4886 [Trichinella spiralis]|uniref:Uncharacterized protein n=1 Tax=Trichinella spiralis TaxID=6334 RepID=A0A0V0ZEL8_TRISP|nr:hypothetical protein T01_4886 [Trichinella spiralis]
MISIPENNFYHYSIFYCTRVTNNNNSEEQPDVTS